MNGVIEGRIVHYVMDSGPSMGRHCPAIIVNSWPGIEQYQREGRVNLHVFTDFTNDGAEGASGGVWRTSVIQSDEKLRGTWHWIEPA